MEGETGNQAKPDHGTSPEDNDTSSELTVPFVNNPRSERSLSPQRDIAHARNLIPPPYHPNSECEDSAMESISETSASDDEYHPPPDSTGYRLALPGDGPFRIVVSASRPAPFSGEESAVPGRAQARDQAVQGPRSASPVDIPPIKSGGSSRQDAPAECLLVDEQKEQDIEDWLDGQPHWPLGSKA